MTLIFKHKSRNATASFVGVVKLNARSAIKHAEFIRVNKLPASEVWSSPA